MALPKITENIAFISALDNEPNDVGGLSATELKAEFDRAGLTLQEYINNDLIPQIESDINSAAQGIDTGGAISGDKLADNSVPGTKIKDGTITATKYGNGSIPTAAYQDDSVTKAKLAPKSVGENEIGDGEIKRKHLADEIIDSTKLFAGAVTEPKFFNGAVSTRAIADGAVTGEKVAAGAVSTDYTASISVEAWTGEAAPYTAAVTVTEILATDKPIIDLVPSEAFETAEAELDAWGMVYRAVTAADSVTFYATDKPTVALNVQMKAVRK